MQYTYASNIYIYRMCVIENNFLECPPQCETKDNLDVKKNNKPRNKTKRNNILNKFQFGNDYNQKHTERGTSFKALLYRQWGESRE